MAQRLSHDGACFCLVRIALAQDGAPLRESSDRGRCRTDPAPARYGVRCAGCSCARARPAGRGRVGDGISQGVAADVSKTPRRAGASPGSSTHSRVRRKS